ncbi:unnamed protein product, partial [Ectocarpus sp. 12 AP-2014]
GSRPIVGKVLLVASKENFLCVSRSRLTRCASKARTYGLFCIVRATSSLVPIKSGKSPKWSRTTPARTTPSRSIVEPHAIDSNFWGANPHRRISICEMNPPTQRGETNEFL